MSIENELSAVKTELVDYEVAIPSSDGTSIRERRIIKIPVYRDPATGEEMLTEEAVHLIDGTKARFMGLLLPNEIRDLRSRMELTQSQFAAILCLGGKTPARWEAGRERPSQSLNLFLKLIRAKAITAEELVYLRESQTDWTKVINVNFSSTQPPYQFEGAPEEPSIQVEAAAA